MSDAPAPPDDDAPRQTFEYRVVPAPRKGDKARGVRSGEARFALAMSRLFNHMGEQGWEYVRADTLPSEERVGLTGTEVRYHSLLVFRRALTPAPTIVQQVIEAPKSPLMLSAPPDEWHGFEEAEIDDGKVVDLLAARAKPPLAAE